MQNLLLVPVCIGLGIFFGKYRLFPDHAHVALNAFVLQLALPAVALFYVPQLPIHAGTLLLLCMSALVMLGAYVLISALGAWLKWPQDLQGCLILLAGLGNTSFIGFPMVEAFYGKEGLQYAVLIDQGSFFAFTLLGIFVASKYTTSDADWRMIGKKILRFPAFWAFLLGLLLGALGISTASWVFLEKLAGTIAPLALVSVGLQFRLERLSASHWPMSVALFYKLLIAPLGIWFLYGAFIEEALPLRVAVMEAGMAPMITATLLAVQSGLRPSLAYMTLAVGIMLSMGTLGVGYWLMR